MAGVGDSFVVHMDREALNDYPMGRYDVTVTIEAFVPDRTAAAILAGTQGGRAAGPAGHSRHFRRLCRRTDE